MGLTSLIQVETHLEFSYGQHRECRKYEGDEEEQKEASRTQIHYTEGRTEINVGFIQEQVSDHFFKGIILDQRYLCNSVILYDIT